MALTSEGVGKVDDMAAVVVGVLGGLVLGCWWLLVVVVLLVVGAVVCCAVGVQNGDISCCL